MRDLLAAMINEREGMGISRIMFHVGLSYAQATAYVTELMDKGLLENTSLGKKFYHTTPKGIELLEAMGNMPDMMLPEKIYRNGRR